MLEYYLFVILLPIELLDLRVEKNVFDTFFEISYLYNTSLELL